MKQNIFLIFLKFLEKLTGKKVVHFPKDRAAKNLTAVKSLLGFWYAGNFLDMSDIAYGILYNGLVEKEGTYLVANILKDFLAKKPKLAFYDIGANTGYFGVMAAFLGNPNRIFTYSIEPVKEFNEVEKETLKLNNLEQSCQIFNLALGEKKTEAEIFLAGIGTSLSKGFIGNRQAPVRKILVERLDDLVKEKELKSPDFIKIDVEGHELSVLKGAEETLRVCQPVIWYESALTIKQLGYKSQDFFVTQKFLESLDYEVFWCGEKIVPAPKNNIADDVGMYLGLHKKAHKDLFLKIPILYERG